MPKEQTAGKKTISWQIPEYPGYEHGFFWYAGLTIVGIALLIYALWTQNFLFAFIIIMFAIVFLVHTGKKHELVKFALEEDGVRLGEKFYFWKDFSRFFIIYEPPEVKTLYLEFIGWKPRLNIHLDDQDPSAIRQFLLNFLKEDVNQVEEPISDWLGRVFKI